MKAYKESRKRLCFYGEGITFIKMRYIVDNNKKESVIYKNKHHSNKTRRETVKSMA